MGWNGEDAARLSAVPTMVFLSEMRSRLITCGAREIEFDSPYITAVVVAVGYIHGSSYYISAAVLCKISGSLILHGPRLTSKVSEFELPLPLLSDTFLGNCGRWDMAC